MRKTLIIFAVLALWSVLQLTGFCFRELRWLSDRELIESSLRGFFDNLARHGLTDGSGQKDVVISKLIAANPGCCHVDRSLRSPWGHPLWLHLIERCLFGGPGMMVYLNLDNGKLQHAETRDNCGGYIGLDW